MIDQVKGASLPSRLVHEQLHTKQNRDRITDPIAVLVLPINYEVILHIGFSHCNDITGTATW
jgi:hypothetical protein